MCFGFLCLQVSSVSHFHLTRGDEGGHLFRLTCSVVLWGGRYTASRYGWCVRAVLTVYGPHWVCPRSRWCALSGITLLRLQVALRGPAFRALPRPKPLRFSFLGTPRGHRLGGACVLCPSQVRAAQVTRCWASALSHLAMCLNHLPIGAAWFPGAPQEHHLWCALCLLWEADLRLRPSW